MKTKVAITVCLVVYLVAAPVAFARGGGGGGRGGGGWGGGFRGGINDMGAGWRGGINDPNYGGGGGINDMEAGWRGGINDMDYHATDFDGQRGLEDPAEWSYEHPGRWGGGGGFGGAGRTSWGGGDRPPVQKVNPVSEAQRVAAANQTYNWGFDRASSKAADSTPAMRPSTEANLVDRGSMIRGNFNKYNAFHDEDWWRRYPNAWWINGWGYGYGWGWGTWDDMVGLMGLAGASDYYDYGDTITYNNNNVYYGSNSVGTQEQYYDEAATLAASGNTSNTSDASAWKPLGVYALAQPGSSSSIALLQLAVDKNGDVGGNYFNELTNDVQPVKGKVNKKNQRVAFTIGSNKAVVYDTGLGNLLSAQAPVLVHFSKTKTEQWTLVRMQQPQQTATK